MKIAICDDEKKYLDQLTHLLNQYAKSDNSTIEIFTYNNAESFINTNLECFDLVFLDVKIGSSSGIDVAKLLRQKNQLAVLVFVSAFVEYAIMGYSVNASAYLLKSDLDGTFESCMLEIKHKLVSELKSSKFIINEQQVSISTENILYVESFKRQVILHTNIEKTPTIEYYAKLSDVQQQLQSRNFLKIHKSFIINMRHCLKIKNRVAYMRNGDELFCSKQKYSEVVDIFLQWKVTE